MASQEDQNELVEAEKARFGGSLFEAGEDNMFGGLVRVFQEEPTVPVSRVTVGFTFQPIAGDEDEEAQAAQEEIPAYRKLQEHLESHGLRCRDEGHDGQGNLALLVTAERLSDHQQQEGLAELARGDVLIEPDNGQTSWEVVYADHGRLSQEAFVNLIDEARPLSPPEYDPEAEDTPSP